MDSSDYILTNNDANQKIAIIGASGFLGKKIYKIFTSAFQNVIGTSYSSSQFHFLNVTNRKEIELFIKMFAPDVIVYAVAEADPACVEKDKRRAMDLNVHAVEFFAECFKGHFIYISTDYIFDGNSPPYKPDSLPNPLNEYGKTKLLGEKKTIHGFKEFSIIRVGYLYGYNDPYDKSTFLRQVIESLDQKKSLIVDNTQIRYPVLIDDVVSFIADIVRENRMGIFQINGPEGVTKYEWAQRIALMYFQLFPQSLTDEPYQIYQEKIFEKNKVDAHGKLKRPHNARMINSIATRPLSIGMQDPIRKLSCRLKGGSFSRTYKLRHDQKFFVRKEAFSEGRQKLLNEIKWLLDLPQDIRPFFPEILRYDTKSKVVYYEMPFYNWPTLTELIIDQGLGAKIAQEILIKILSFYCTEFIHHRQDISPPDYLDNFLIKKIRERIEMTKRMAPVVFADIIDAPTLIINGKDCSNILTLLEKVQSNILFKNILNPPFLALTHGDLHFDNILVTDKSFMFLDPRGDRVGDPIYDIAKIIHTIVGKYDFLNYDLHETNVEKSNNVIAISLEYLKNHPAWPVYKSLENNLCQIFKNVKGYDILNDNDPNLSPRLAFTHSALFASDMPFHLKGDEKETRAIAIYATGVLLLNEFFREYRKS